MGFFRGGFVILFSILLFLSLLTLGSFFTISSSLSYENVQDEIAPLASDLVTDISGDNLPGDLEEEVPENLIEDVNLSEVTGQAIEVLEEHCVNNTDYVFSYEGYTADIPCEVVEEGAEAIINETIEDVIEEIYYDEYDCGFFDCLTETGQPFFLISDKARKYWKSNIFIPLLVSLIIIVLLFFLLENKLNLPIITGSLLILSSLPLLKIQGIVSSIVGDSYLSFLSLFFSKAGSVFWMFFIPGLIILGLGIVLRFVKPDFLKTKFSRKDVKRIVKKSNPDK